MNTKKIIFFDGDGTLWYPKSTKRTRKPHWIYHNPETQENYLEHLALTTGVLETLEKLHHEKIMLAVISANPNPEKEALAEMKDKLNYFKIAKYFQHCFVSDGSDPKAKSAKILKVLQQEKLPPGDALMIGDSYYYDYLAAREIGLDALWIENEVAKKPENMPDNLQSVSEVSGILKYLT